MPKMTLSAFAGALAIGAGAALFAQGGAPPFGPAAAPAGSTVVEVGEMAADFTLEGTEGKTHTVSDYRGKTNVVVAWFPKAFTQGCTIECKSLAESGDRIKK